MGNMRIDNESSGFIVGVAYNLHFGFDFGDQLRIQTDKGVSVMPPGLDDPGRNDPKRADTVMDDFRKLRESGVNAVTIKLFTDGRTGIDFDPKDPGRALGVQKSVFKGLENVMKIAGANGIAVQIVLFDHTFAAKEAGLLDPKEGRKQLGPERKQGHLQALANPDNRELLLRNVIAPVLKYLRGRSNLLAVELVNEPESIIEGMHLNKGQKGIPKAQTEAFKEYMRTVRDLVHDAGAQFTVGCLGIAYAKQWLDVIDPQRDFISVHYYENSQNLDPKYGSLYGADSELMKLHKAGVTVVFGEYAGSGYGKVGTKAFLEDARAHGIVKGALGAWSMYDGNGKPGAANFLVPLDDLRHFRLLNPFSWHRGPAVARDGLNHDASQIPAPGGTPSPKKLEGEKEIKSQTKEKNEIKEKAHKPPAKGREDFGL